MLVDNRLLDDNHLVHICYVTDDLDEFCRWFGDLVGLPIPDLLTAGPVADYPGRSNVPTTARVKFFAFANCAIEVIEPGPEASDWRKFLDEHGTACHHIAFISRDIKKHTKYLASKGHPLLQRGEFTGGRYAYFDTYAKMGMALELLEFDDENTIAAIKGAN